MPRARGYWWVMALAACTTQSPLPPDEDAEPAEQDSQASEPQIKLRYLDHMNLKPMPDTLLSVSSRCARKDEIGTVTRLSLSVKSGKVAMFSANIRMAQGTCQFDLNDFTQTASLPQVVLQHRSLKDCHIRMWTQDQQVTIAYNTCRGACSGDSFDYLWPTLVNRRNGRCD